MSVQLVRVETHAHITTITMDHPRRLNGWTASMLQQLLGALRAAGSDPNCHAIVLTGTGEYYSAGVNLGGTLRIDHPRTLHAAIIEQNQALFDTFLDLPKPIVVAVNGHAIGAPVTSATLCDAIVAAETATFSTPFARLGVTPEGCSSVHFSRLMGAENAQRMLGPEGWRPTASEAEAVGLIDRVVPGARLLEVATELARTRIPSGRTFRGHTTRGELKAVNARESAQLADAFLSAPFLRGQMRFLWSKKKWGPAALFAGLWLSSPIWRRLL